MLSQACSKFSQHPSEGHPRVALGEESTRELSLQPIVVDFTRVVRQAE